MYPDDTTLTEKRCPVCNHVKSASDFYKSKSRKDGLAYRCKSCQAEYRKQYRASEHGREVTNRLAREGQNSEKGKAYRREYKRRPEVAAKERAGSLRRYLSPEGQERSKLHNASKSHRESVLRYQERTAQDPINRLRVRAVNTIATDVKLGKRPPAHDLICDYCGKPAHEYHHYLGYEREHWRDVIPLCRKCHADIHRIKD